MILGAKCQALYNHDWYDAVILSVREEWGEKETVVLYKVLFVGNGTEEELKASDLKQGFTNPNAIRNVMPPSKLRGSTLFPFSKSK